MLSLARVESLSLLGSTEYRTQNTEYRIIPGKGTLEEPQRGPDHVVPRDLSIYVVI